MQYRAAIFDLDGTLVDTLEDLAISVNEMLASYGFPTHPLDEYRYYLGNGSKKLIERTLPKEKAADEAFVLEAMKRYQAIYEHHRDHTGPFPGIQAMLDALKAKGIPMAVITNKAHAFTIPLLEMTGLAGYFDVVVSGDTLPKIKPDPMALVWACGRLDVSPADAVFVGDSVNDFLAGRAAGCHVFLLPYGYNEGRDVQELDCDAIVPSVLSAAQRIRKIKTA